LDKPKNSFDSLQAIINAFKAKYGDKREGRHFLRTINNIKKNENETVDEFRNLMALSRKCIKIIN